MIEHRVEIKRRADFSSAVSKLSKNTGLLGIDVGVEVGGGYGGIVEVGFGLGVEVRSVGSISKDRTLTMRKLKPPIL